VPSSPPKTDHVIAVAVPVPGLGILSYLASGRTAAPPKGARVRVPLGSRTITGCVVDAALAKPTEAALRPVTAVVDEEPFLPAPVVDLALWVADYYASGPGDALAMALPPSARGDRRTAFRTVSVVELVAQEGSRTPRGARQRDALTALTAAPAGQTLTSLGRLGVSAATVRGLATQGFVRLRPEVVERDPFAPGVGWSWTGGAAPEPPILTAEQSAAVDRLHAAAAERRFQTALVQGVTGSGKSEVYLALARAVIAEGARVLVLVPEIALTPALAGLFHARVGARVAIQHSGLSDGERHDQWHRIRRGEVDVVVGTRSAVFAPIERLGLIVVDEEHEASYKQEEAPRYHGRDVAVMRGRMEGALVVLGSATPSLESAVNAEAGRYLPIRLTRRVLDRPLAAVRVVDMRREYATRGARVTLSQPLLEALALRLARHEQALVLLNRRGFATVIFCRQCGASLECPHCSITLTFHRAARRMRCHYCNYAAAVPRRCGACGGEYLEQSGVGTERLEAELGETFPAARILRVDRDTMRRRGAVARALAAVAARDVDVLIGTQMIAKGHDFPAVTLVGVISADIGLGMADFRAAERTFQLLTQVVGRAGRGTVPGEAIIQTLYPDHYSVQAAAAQDYHAFFTREAEFRRGLHYPPAVALINVIVKAGSLGQALDDAAALAAAIRGAPSPPRVLGPAPAVHAKIRDEYRAQLLLKGTRRRPMRDALTAALVARPDLARRTIVDVDPVSVV
jgi:primosomal protein N' (replication factor Y)